MKQQIDNNCNSVDERSPLVLYTVADVAAILLLPVKAVHKLVREEKLACVQVTTRERRFTREQVQEYICARSTSVRVDKKPGPAVSSRPKKGGDRAKSSGVFSRQALLEEMRKCR